MASDVRAGGAFVDLYTKNEHLRAGLAEGQAMLLGWGEVVRNIGLGLAATSAAVMAPLTAATKVFADRSKDMQEAAKKLDIPVAMTTALEYAAAQLGTSLKELGKDADKWREFIADAGGAEQLAVLVARARELGLVMRDEDVTAAKEYRAALSELWAVLKQLSFTLGAAVAPAIGKATRQMTDAIAKVAAWAQENRAWVNAAFRVLQYAALIGSGAAAAGTAIIFIGEALASLGTIAASLGLVLSPLGLITAGFAGLALALVKFTNVGATVKNYLAQVFGDLAADVRAAFNGVRDALASGNVALAAQIMWLALRKEWARGIAGLESEWGDWATGVLVVMNNLSGALAGKMLEAFAQIRSAWATTLTFLTTTWTSASGSIASWILSMRHSIEREKIAWKYGWDPEKKAQELARIDAFYAEAQQNLQQDIGTKNNEAANKAAIDAARRKADLDAQLKNIGQDTEAGQQGIIDKGNKRKADAQAAYAAAKKEFDDAVKRAGNEAAARPKAGDLQLPDLDKQKTSVLGTFNGLVAGQLGGGSTLIQILAENRRMRGELEKLNQKPGAAGVGFA